MSFNLALNEWNNQNLVPGSLFTGCFAIPFCVAIFFFEMNIKRDMPFFEIIKGFLLGGIFSLIITLLLSEYATLVKAAWWAGFTEEPAKLIATIMIIRPMYRRGSVLQGMAMGCAVGAGFAAFETAGYVYRYLGMFSDLHIANSMGIPEIAANIINNSAILYDIPLYVSYNEFMSNPGVIIHGLIQGADPDKVLWIRALLAPFCHVVWSAITAGAFWHIMAKRKEESNKKEFSIDLTSIGDKLTFGLYQYTMKFTNKDGKDIQNKLDLCVFTDYRFIAIFICPVLLHAFWNSPLLADYYLIRNLIIGTAGWALALLLVQIGINQVKREKEKELHRAEEQSSQS